MDFKLLNGDIIDVRGLMLYELSINVPFDDPGPYQIFLLLDNGTEQVIDYDLSRFKTPPLEPDKPFSLCNPQSYESVLWERFNHYQAALARNRNRIEAGEKHAHKAAQYILENCLVNEADQTKITASDYPLLYQFVICPEVIGRDIEAVLADIFQGFVQETAFV